MPDKKRGGLGSQGVFVTWVFSPERGKRPGCRNYKLYLQLLGWLCSNGKTMGKGEKKPRNGARVKKKIKKFQGYLGGC